MAALNQPIILWRQTFTTNQTSRKVKCHKPFNTCDHNIAYDWNGWCNSDTCKHVLRWYLACCLYLIVENETKNAGGGCTTESNRGRCAWTACYFNFPRCKKPANCGFHMWEKCPKMLSQSGGNDLLTHCHWSHSVSAVRISSHPSCHEFLFRREILIGEVCLTDYHDDCSGLWVC